jgi:hypothetical protein
MCRAASWGRIKEGRRAVLGMSAKEGAGSPETMTVEGVLAGQTKVGKTGRRDGPCENAEDRPAQPRQGFVQIP